MLPLNHHLSLYTKLSTVLDKEDWYEIKTMSHHSQHHFVTQYIFLKCITAVNEFYQDNILILSNDTNGHVKGNRTETDE